MGCGRPSTASSARTVSAPSSSEPRHDLRLPGGDLLVGHVRHVGSGSASWAGERVPGPSNLFVRPLISRHNHRWYRGIRNSSRKLSLAGGDRPAWECRPGLSSGLPSELRSNNSGLIHAPPFSFYSQERSASGDYHERTNQSANHISPKVILACGNSRSPRRAGNHAVNVRRSRSTK
jgi:hypothetical protein